MATVGVKGLNSSYKRNERKYDSVGGETDKQPDTELIFNSNV